MFGDRLIIANATGCSSIYGGNLPTTPYTTNACGRGPAWANSLFEDNAEFGLGMRASLDQSKVFAEFLLRAQAIRSSATTSPPPSSTADHRPTRPDRSPTRTRRRSPNSLARRPPKPARSTSLADYLVDKSVWIVGGDGWAYDIGFGGLDHVIASGRNVNILVLDTEVYSNTGGQHRNPHRSARSRSSAWPARRCRKKTSASSPRPTARSMSPASPSARRTATRCPSCARPKASRSLARHRLQPLRRPRLQHVARPRTTETRRRLRILAAVPLRSPPRRKRRKPDETRLRRPERQLCATSPPTKPVSKCSNASTRNAPPCSMEMAAESVKERFALYQQMAASLEQNRSDPAGSGITQITETPNIQSV
jgi:hypothetical protein